ncbi:hypothetical protein BH11PAT1_BH11PAT1_6490 [soil metagenome]
MGSGVNYATTMARERMMQGVSGEGEHTEPVQEDLMALYTSKELKSRILRLERRLLDPTDEHAFFILNGVGLASPTPSGEEGIKDFTRAERFERQHPGKYKRKMAKQVYKGYSLGKELFEELLSHNVRGENILREIGVRNALHQYLDDPTIRRVLLLVGQVAQTISETAKADKKEYTIHEQRALFATAVAFAQAIAERKIIPQAVSSGDEIRMVREKGQKRALRDHVLLFSMETFSRQGHTGLIEYIKAQKSQVPSTIKKK